MIELNCSYEQSKKILDLGYDFTFICRDFELREEKEITKFVLVEKHDDGLVSLWDCSERKTCIYSTKSWWIVPIIPKAGLEKCLPDFLYVKGFDGELDRSRFVKRLCNGMIDLNSQDSATVSHDWFNSVYEAFIWCHNNYPEELKAKFEEVMA